MYDSSACGAGNADCLKCPKAVDNLILFASHSRGFHFIVPRCDNNIIMFLLKGEALINSKEYAGVTLHAGEFILQAIGSKYEVLATTDVECVCYRFSRPESFCEGRYRHIGKKIRGGTTSFTICRTELLLRGFEVLFGRGEDLQGVTAI